VGLTWPTLADCARDHKAIENYKHRRGQAEDKMAGPGPMSGKVVQGPDLIMRQVKDGALRRAIYRTAR
jgi:hypothetical protein